jgi:hypothetical protein
VVHVLLGLGEAHADQQPGAREEVDQRAERPLAVLCLERARVARISRSRVMKSRNGLRVASRRRAPLPARSRSNGARLLGTRARG